MSNDDTEFMPNQIERQIDLLARDQEGRVHVFSDARLISDLYQAHMENHAIVERVWQRLSLQVESTRPLAAPRSEADVFLRPQERPQDMEITVINKRPPRLRKRFLEACAAILIVAALLAGTLFVLNNAHQAPTASTRVVTNSGLYVRTPHRVSRWDLASGKVLWNYNTGQRETVLSGIYIVDNVVIFQISNNNSSVSEIVGVDASTGQQLWTQTQQTRLETVSDGVVIGSTISYTSRSGGMYKSPVSTITAYQATTGQQLWSYTFAPTSNPQPVTGVANWFASAQGVLYINSGVQRMVQGVVTTSLPELVIAVSIASGKQIWQKAIDSDVQWLVAEEKNLYLFGTMANGKQGEVFAINGANGNQIWQTTIIGNIHHYPDIPFSPTVANGILYIDSATGQGDEYSPHIYAYSTSNGALLKNYMLGSQEGFAFSPLVIHDLLLYSRSAGNGPGVYNEDLVALDIKTWQPAWSVYVGPTSSLEPQIANDIIYMPSGNNLLAYTTSGKLLHSYQTQTTVDANWYFTVVA